MKSDNELISELTSKFTKTELYVKITILEKMIEEEKKGLRKKTGDAAESIELFKQAYNQK